MSPYAIVAPRSVVKANPPNAVTAAKSIINIAPSPKHLNILFPNIPKNALNIIINALIT